MAATWEHPRQSFAVVAAMQVAGVQLQSAQRIILRGIGDHSFL